MTQVVAYLEAIVGADITSFRRGMQDVRRETGILSDDFTGMAGNLRQVGRDMTYSLTTPLLAVGKSAVDAASDFDASMHNINSIAHMTQGEFDKLSKQVLDFGTSTRSGPQAVADSLYEIYSAGLTGSKAFDLMQQSVKTAEAGLADLEKTTNALTATVMAYSNQNLTASEASNVWTKMVQVGVGSLDDFLANAQKVLPLASNLGISFQDLGANAAYLSQQGGGAKKAMTALAMAFSSILKPTDTMIEAFGRLGVANGQDLIKKFGSFEGAVIALHNVVKDPIEFNKMFSKTGLEAVLSMTNNVDALNKSIADFGVGLNDATQTAWDEQMKSYAASADKFNSAIDGLRIAIGQQLFPLLTSILTPVTQFVTQLAQANPEVLKIAVAFGVAVAAAGPLIWIFSSLFTPIGLLVGGVTALGVAFATNFGGIRDTVNSVVTEAMRLLAPFIEMVKAAWEVVSGTGITLEQGKDFNTFVDKANEAITSFLNGPAAIAPTTKPINIKIKAGMTLSEIYYNSEWSKDLQKMFSYDDFVAAATKQIKGGNPKWLQVGSTLSFGVPISPKLDPTVMDTADMMVREANIGSKFNLTFLAIKDEIQRQYDYIFKGKPLVNAQGQDISGQLPVLETVKNVINNVKLVVDTWKDAFGKSLANIRDGISGFFDGFKGADYSGLVKVFSTAVTVINDVWTVVNIIGSKILIWATDVLKDTLPRMGQAISHFIQIFSNIANGNFSVGNLDQLILDIANVIGTIVDKLLGGNGFDAAKGLTEFAQDIQTAIMLVTFAVENGWRDLKIAINNFVSGFFSSLNDAMTKLHDAHLISDEQFISFKISANNIKLDTTGAEFAKAIEEGLRSGLNIGNINIGSDNLRTVVNMGGAQAIANNLTVIGKENLVQAIKKSVAGNNKDGMLDVLLPIAIAGNLDMSKVDFSKLSADVRTKLADALKVTPVETGDQTTFAGFMEAGKNLINGLINGFDTNKSDAVNAATKVSQAMKDAVNNDLGIASPSKWAIGVSGFIVSGLVMGLAVGTILVAAATKLMILLGIKLPMSTDLTAGYGNSKGTDFTNSIASGITAGIPNLQAAVNGVINAFSALKTTVIGIGNDLASQMQGIVDRLTGQLNSLKNAVKEAAGLSVPSGGGSTSGGGTAGHTPIGGYASGGDGVQGWNIVGERGPELAYFGNKGTVIPTHTIRDAMTNNNYSNNSSNSTVIVNGVQDVDKLLFELKRRGIKFA